MYRRLLVALAALAIVATACGDDAGSGTTSGSGPTLVVATTTQLADFARELGGGRVKVVGLVGPNVDAHDYEPTPANLKALGDAALIVRNGAGLDEWFDDAAASVKPKAPIVDASEAVKVVDEDPHIWFDPTMAAKIVESIAAGLKKADPAGESIYAANLTRYLKELDTLDKEIAGQIGKLSNKKLVTDHDAFGYYIDRYGLELVGSVIPSLETSAELSAQEVSELVAKIKATGVKAIFAEASLPAKTAKSIAKEAGIKVVDGESAFYGDSLGTPNSSGGTYLKMMRHNTKTIVTNLS